MALAGVITIIAVASLTLLASDASASRRDHTPDAGHAVERPGAVPGQTELDGARLDLIDQTFAVEANGDLRFVYVLHDLAGDPLELATTTTTTTTPTTTPITIPSIADDTLPDGALPAPPPEAATTTAPPPLRLTVRIVNYAPLTDTDDVARVVGSDVDPGVFDRVSTDVDGVAFDARPLASLDDDGNATFVFDVGTDVENSVADRLKFDRPGIYPVRIQLVASEGDSERIVATAGTIVQRLTSPTDATSAPPPIDLAVLVATPDLAPNAPPADAAAAEAAFDAAIAFADAFPSSAAFRLPPPLVADAASTSAGAAAIGDALADDELVSAPSIPLDVSSAVAADRADAYTRLVIAGEDLLRDAVPTTPTRRDLWVASSPLSGAAAQLLRDLGTRFIVMTEEVYRDSISRDIPATDLFVTAALPDGGSLPLLVVDPIGEQLDADAAAAILGDSTATEWAVQVVGEMLLDQADADIDAISSGETRPDRGRVLATPDLSPPDVELLDSLVTLVDTTPSIQFTTATSLAGVVDVRQVNGAALTVQLPETAGPSLTDRIALIESTAWTMASVATMLPPDDPRPAAWTAELEALVSTAYTDAEVLAATADMLAEADALRSAVVLPEPMKFTLTGQTGTFETRLTNTADEPLNVLVEFRSAKLTFPDGDQIVTLRPAGETSLIVPVEARANGTSSIEMTVSTPAGEPLGPPVPLTATVTALTGVGQVLTVGLVLVLATWWFTHWRSRRRDAALSTAEADGADTAPVESDAL